MRTGLRVRPRWREEPKGELLDLACFEPDDRVGTLPTLREV
jgi:hypothetical protein